MERVRRPNRRQRRSVMSEANRILALETVRLERHGPNVLRMIGVMAMRDPPAEVGAWFRQLHEQLTASDVNEFVVDVTLLKFMNSSSIRVFVDWLAWLRKDRAAYVIAFKINPGITWQRTTFGALRAL